MHRSATVQRYGSCYKHRCYKQVHLLLHSQGTTTIRYTPINHFPPFPHTILLAKVFTQLVLFTERQARVCLSRHLDRHTCTERIPYCRNWNLGMRMRSPDPRAPLLSRCRPICGRLLGWLHSFYRIIPWFFCTSGLPTQEILLYTP